MPEFKTINYSQDGPVAIISLNRPGKLNAISPDMVKELHAALDEAESNDGVRAILLRGEGKAYSAGFDLDVEAEEGVDSTEFWRAELRRNFDIIMRFWDSPKPTIAAVHKYCLGSAMEMATACDITIAAEGTRFGAPEVKFGSGIVALILPWVIGAKQAKELLLTGNDKVSAERALDLGLVNHVVDEDQLQAKAMAMASTIAANDRLAVRLTKQAINMSLESMNMRDAMLRALEIDVEIETTETPESKEFNRILSEEGTRAALEWRQKNIDGRN